MTTPTDKHLRCSFCGKSKESVKNFISGPNVYICNECISLCNEILAEEEDHSAESFTHTPKPREIKDKLEQAAEKGAWTYLIYRHDKPITGRSLDKAELVGKVVELLGQ